MFRDSQRDPSSYDRNDGYSPNTHPGGAVLQQAGERKSITRVEFLICCITFQFEEFQSAAIGGKIKMDFSSKCTHVS